MLGNDFVATTLVNLLEDTINIERETPRLVQRLQSIVPSKKKREPIVESFD